MRRPRHFIVLALLTTVVVVAAALVGVVAGRLAAPDESAQLQATSPAPSRSASERRVPTATPSSRAPGATPIPVLRGDAARGIAVPILMYHVIGTPPASAPLPDLWVATERFREQVDALARAGYQAVTLKALIDGWARGGPLPRRPVVLTFDDGYLSHATAAEPAMRRHGWPGVINLTLNNLGADGLPRRQAARLQREGWEFASHTITHPDLRTIDDAALRRELVESRRRIREELGVTPRFFCYPAGKYDARVLAAVRSAGYEAATTVEPGIARRTDAKLELPRVRITNADSGRSLVQRLSASLKAGASGE